VTAVLGTRAPCVGRERRLPPLRFIVSPTMTMPESLASSKQASRWASNPSAPPESDGALWGSQDFWSDLGLSWAGEAPG
jgi:anti-sigma-K factor RskA